MSSLQDNMRQLETDTLDEIEIPDAKVVILSLKSSYGSKSNITRVVFGIDLETKDPSLSIASRIDVCASLFFRFVSMSSVQQYVLRLFVFYDMMICIILLFDLHSSIKHKSTFYWSH
ncbi:hypothetical protein Droror1_Dr00020873 [Drosera rotundifolia]